jgi:predicted permease
MGHDLIYSLRLFRKSPGLAAVAILSLGLGIGLNLTVFGGFESLFLRGVTAADPDHTFHLWAGGSNRASCPNYLGLRDSHAVPTMAAYSLMQFSLGRVEHREKIVGQAVAGDYFEMLGVRPILGRGFTEEEKRPERDARVALLSYPLWKQRFAGSRQALDDVLWLNGQPFQIVGVLPEGYRSLHGFGSEPPFYVPYSGAIDSAWRDRGSHGLELVLRTAPGQTGEQAAAALLSAANDLERRYPNENRNFGQVRLNRISVVDQQGGARKGLLFFVILSVVVGLVLLIACANVAGLLVARAVNRRREIAIRLAIGGSRARLVRLFFAEGAVLATAGLAAATVIYAWGTRLIERLPMKAEVPFYFHAELNWRMGLYGAAIAATAALMSSFAPALEACRSNVSAALKNETEAASRGRLFSLRNNLVIGQVAVSVLLLVTSLLFVRSLRDVQTADPGFNVRNQLLATVRLDVPGRGGNALTENVMERLAGLPGVRSVTAAMIVPLSFNSWMTAVRIGNDAHRQPVVQANAVGANYFATVGIRVLAGREFGKADSKNTPPVAVVNRTFVGRFLGGSDPLGQVVSIPKGRDREQWQIVGIVADSKHESLGEDPTPVIYRPLAQEDPPLAPTIHVRTAWPSAAMVTDVREALRTAFPQALVEVTTMETTVASSTLPNQIGAALLGAMGALGLVLASVGLYGVLAFAVSRRVREIGVRIALGASTSHVLRIVIGQAMALVGTGVASGLALALMATRPLAGFLSAGVSATDPTTLVAVAAMLGLTALVAAFVPAVRALRLDPMRALRCE